MVVLDLRRRRADGTTQLVFDPVEFIERLAALVPRPRTNLVLYYGVLAPASDSAATYCAIGSDVIHWPA